MKDRKILYILLLTVLIGSAVTLCTGFLTGGMDWAGQVTVTLEEGAGLAETGGNGGPAVRTIKEAPGGNAVRTADGRTIREETAETEADADGSLPVPEVRLQSEAVDPAADPAPADVVKEAAADAAAGGPAAGAEQTENEAFAEAAAETEEKTGGQVQQTTDKSAAAAAPIYTKGSPQQVALSPLETTAAEQDTSMMVVAENAVKADGGASLEENLYYIRLTELDAQIQKSRAAQNGSNPIGADSSSLARNTADNELKLWDSELNVIYNEILKSLDEKQTQELVTAERQWMKSRDASAVEAAKNSAGGSLESVEYTASLAQSTRSRAYELVELYAAVLTE